MGVDLYIACRDCSCAIHSQINARHEVAESLCELRWDPELGERAREWMWDHPDFGPESEVTQTILEFSGAHTGHRLGMAGYESTCAWPWRREATPLPSGEELRAGLSAKKQDARLRAARLARYTRRDDAVAPLLSALAKDRALKVRAEAAKSLASLAASLGGDELDAVVEALSSALAHPKEAVVAGAAQAMAWLAAGIPEEERAPLVERDAALWARLEEPLLEALGRGLARGTILAALGECASERSLESALAALRDVDPRVVSGAARCLSAVARGGLGASAAGALLQAAEASLGGAPTHDTLQSWGKILSACGPTGLGALQRLHDEQGWFHHELRAALIPATRTWPFPAQESAFPVAHQRHAPPGIELVPLPVVEGAHAPGGSHAGVTALCARGGRVAATDGRGVASVWDLGAPGEAPILRRTFSHYETAQDLSRRGPLLGAALSADGSLLAVGAERGEVWVWDLESGEELATFRAPACLRLTFTREDQLLVVTQGSVLRCGFDGARLAAYPPQVGGKLQGAALDPRGERLALWGTSSPRENALEVVVVDLEGRHVATLVHAQPVRSLAWSRGGARLATLTQDRGLTVWELGGGPARRVQSGVTRGDYSLEFRADGLWAGGTRAPFEAGGGAEAPAQQRPLATRGKDTLTLRVPHTSGEVCATLERRALRVAGPEGETLWSLEGDFYDVHTLEVDAAGESLLVPMRGRGHPTPPGWVARYALLTGEELGRIGGAYLPGDVQVSPDGRLLATGGAHPAAQGNLHDVGRIGPLTLYDLQSGEVRAVFQDTRRNPDYCPGEQHLRVTAVAFSPDGSSLAAASEGALTLWDRQSGAARWRTPVWAPANWFHQLWFTPDGAHLVASRTDDHIVVVSAATGEVLRAVQRRDRHRYPATLHFAPLPDGRLVLGRHGLEVFDLPALLRRPAPSVTPRERPASPAPREVEWLEGTCLAVGPAGEVALGGPGGVRVLEAEGSVRWERSSLHVGGSASVAISACGTHVASAGWDGVLQLLDARSGEARALVGATSFLRDVGFLEGGARVFATTSEGTLALWDVASGEPLLATRSSCAAAVGGLLFGGADHAYKLGPVGAARQGSSGRASPRCNLYVFSAETLELLREIEPPDTDPAIGVHSLVAGPARRFVAALRPTELLLIPLEEGAAIVRWEGAFACAAWRPDGRQLALARREGGIQLVDVSLAGTLQAGSLLPGGRARALAFAPRAHLLALNA